MTAESGAGDREILAVLRLVETPGLGAVTLRRLFERYGSGEAVERAVLMRRAGVPEEAVSALASRDVRSAAAGHSRALKDLGGRMVTASSPDYPARLRRLTNPPAALFLRGRRELMARPAVAVVGTRRATRYGRDATRLLVDGLARAGVAVVSGLARGIDGAAHASALEAGGTTIAVLGTGLAVTYPREHTRLQEDIARSGLLVTELPPNAGPRSHQFPIRNRVIAGLADAVIVVEAGLRSGTHGTVEYALGLGLDVFAVPGPIGREQSEGTNALLRDGAPPATCAEDVLAVIGVKPAARAERAEVAVPPGPGRAILTALDGEALSAEEIARRTDAGMVETLVALLDLEVAGLVRRLPGARFGPVAIPTLHAG